MIDSLRDYEALAREIIPEDILSTLEPEEQRVIGLIVFRTLKKLKAATHDELGFKIKHGIQVAKSRGTRCGRPPKITDNVISQMKLQRSQGSSYRELSQRFSLAVGTIYRALRVTQATA